MKLNAYIDHTNLKPDATAQDILALCQEAKEHAFHSVAVNSCRTQLCAEALAGSSVVVCACIGFPLGAATTQAKVAETQQAVLDGAGEIDMVLNIGCLRDGNDQAVENDIRAVVAAAGSVPVKVILECCLLTDDEKKRACQVALNAGAAFVKTSTGFSTGGATEHDVALMKACVGDSCKIKAAGGIRSREMAEALIAAGADRLGTSSGIELCAEQPCSE